MVAAEAVMEAVVVRENFAWRVLMEHNIYYIFLCLEHEQIKFESLTFSLLDIHVIFGPATKLCPSTPNTYKSHFYTFETNKRNNRYFLKLRLIQTKDKTSSNKSNNTNNNDNNNTPSNQNVLHIYLGWIVSPRVNCYICVNARPYKASLQNNYF